MNFQTGTEVNVAKKKLLKMHTLNLIVCQLDDIKWMVIQNK